MTSVHARKALLASGWSDDVRIEISEEKIAAVQTGVPVRPDDLAAGIVVPGLVNAHSHAFQRVLAGHTERRGPENKDTFWTWRRAMYRLAGLMSAERLLPIARQLYTEMLCAGYTGVAEFHYLHREAGATRETGAMLEAIAEAARDSGIRLTYVPVLYERSGFGRDQLSDAQRQFAMTFTDFLDHYERAAALAPSAGFGMAVGAHSLRAVSESSMKELAALADRDDLPLHLHIAEQLREVQDCVAVHGMRPIEWLLDQHKPDERWCLVHATHVTNDEITALAQTKAVICLCPSTEGNLGDGIFPLRAWLEHDGAVAIGSDSHTTVNPFEELRWLEYGQRLITRSRNVAAVHRPETGRSLFQLASAGGARVTEGSSGRLSIGEAADLIVLDDDSPMFIGHEKESILDALVFSGFTLPIDRVMVAGEWQVVDGRHRSSEEARADYARVVRDMKLELEAVR